MESSSPSALRDAFSQFDETACALEALCCFEYRIERSGEHQRHVMLMKQTNSKTFLLNQDMRESPKAVDFKHMAFSITEKALTFYVSHEMQKLKSVVLDQLLEAYKTEC